jgi:insulin-like growth factor 2 mRNA-binding protein 1
VSELSGYVYEGVSLKVEFSMERRSRGRGGSRGGAGAGFSGLPGSGRQTDFPLRILVQSDMVGAIIGRQGSTIRQITQQTRARLVYRPVVFTVHHNLFLDRALVGYINAS